MPATNQNNIVVKEVTTKRELRRFVQFGIDLYKGNPYYCPPIFLDEMGAFGPKTNPALEVCDHVIYMAYRNGQIVGRIVGIVKPTGPFRQSMPLLLPHSATASSRALNTS